MYKVPTFFCTHPVCSQWTLCVPLFLVLVGCWCHNCCCCYLSKWEVVIFVGWAESSLFWWPLVVIALGAVICCWRCSLVWFCIYWLCHWFYPVCWLPVVFFVINFGCFCCCCWELLRSFLWLSQSFLCNLRQNYHDLLLLWCLCWTCCLLYLLGNNVVK